MSEYIGAQNANSLRYQLVLFLLTLAINGPDEQKILSGHRFD